MKTIIWKELREQWKWAALALLALTLAEVYALYQQRDRASDWWNSLTLCSSTFLLVTTAGCALIGAGLGTLQILPELRRDRWVALLHRPVPPNTIFFGKAIAGLLLYVAATAPPLLVSVGYVASPGQFPAPFVPGLAIPAASDLFVGMVFYFAALLVSLTRGPWYGRRGLLALAVVPALLAHLATPWIFLVPLAASTLFAIAACGMMTHHGLTQGTRRFTRLLTIGLLLTGAESAIFLILWGMSLLPGAANQPPPGFVYRNFVFTAEGNVYLSVRRPNDPGYDLTDLNGKAVPAGKNSADLLQSLGFFNPAFTFNEDRNLVQAYLALHPRVLRNYATLVNGQSYDDPEAWYYLPQRRYFEGYDRLSRRLIGFADSTGFHSAEATPHPFPSPLRESGFGNSAPFLFFSDDQAIALDFANRKSTLLLDTRGENILGIVPLTGHNGEPLLFGGGTKKEIQILDTAGKLLFAVPYHHDPAIWSGIAFATTPAADRIFVDYIPDSSELSNRTERPARLSFVEELDLKGHVTHTYSAMITDSFTPRGWLNPVADLTLPFAPAAVYKIASQAFSRYGPDKLKEFFEIFWLDVPFYLPFSAKLPSATLAILFGISLALAVAAYFWARHAGFGQTEARLWTAFVFCFGLPGLITFRVAANWPSQVSCPSCHHQRPVETEECPVCRQPWPRLRQTGTEIFHFSANGAA